MPTVRSNSGVFWQSGQKGALLKYGDTAATKSTTPLKSTVKVQILTDKNDNTKSSNSPSSKKGNYCAECGKKSHVLTRTKSGVPVCKECHSRLAAKVKTRQTKTHSTERDKFEGTLSSTKLNSHATANGGSLLEGMYDEEANAASFAEALAEWRSGGGGDSKANDSTTSVTLGNSAGCQTVTSRQRTNPIPEIHTSGSVTYLERLMIRRNRYDPKFLQNTVAVPKASSTTVPTSMTLPTQEYTADTVVPSPYNVFYEVPPEHSNTVSFQVDSNMSTSPATDLVEGHTSVSAIKPLAMQAAIKEAWTNKEDIGNLSQFFLSGVDENKTITHVGESQDKETPYNVMLGHTTGTWKPEQSVIQNHNSSINLSDEDSDDNTDALDLADCESDKEEWEMDDRITLECLERELQASQLGNNPEQESNNHNSDFEETERETEKDEQ